MRAVTPNSVEGMSERLAFTTRAENTYNSLRKRGDNDWRPL